MAWHDLFNALALVLIIEGLIPFISPGGLKKTYLALLQMPESTLRLFGLGGIVAGLILLYLT